MISYNEAAKRYAVIEAEHGAAFERYSSAIDPIERQQWRGEVARLGIGAHEANVLRMRALEALWPR